MNNRRHFMRTGVAWASGLGVPWGMSRGEGNVRTQSRGTHSSLPNLRSQGYVIVTPEGPRDGGDFGKFTPGTMTAGIQEAIQHAKAHYLNLYIIGAQGDRKGGGNYAIQETIHIPPLQGFRIDGGEYVLSYQGKTGDAIHIDSCMDCWYKFGLITTRSTGATVLFGPENPVPIDGFTVITDSAFEFSSIVGGGSFDLTSKKISGGRGSGIKLDASAGSILWNRIFAVAVLLCDKGVYLTRAKSSHVVRSNWIQVLHNHQCHTHLQLGDAEDGEGVSLNRLDMSIESEGIPGSIGAQIFGQKNYLTLDVGGSAANQGVVFEPESRDNVVNALNIAHGFTNNATHPTNRIIPPWPAGFEVETPPIPPSERAVTNRNPLGVQVMFLQPGEVTEWTLSDAKGGSQTVQAGLHAGQNVALGPGDGIKFTYSTPPAWRWRSIG